jgi:hypothetical protein
VFAECDLFGASATVLFPGMPFATYLAGGRGVMINAGNVQLVHCSVQGGDCGMWNVGGNLITQPGGEAVFVYSSTPAVPSLRVVGTAAHPLRGGAAIGGGNERSVLGWNGTARIDPLIPLTGSPQVSGGIVLTQPTMLSVLAASAPPGGVLTVSRFGAPGVAMVLVLGLVGPSSTMPGILDPLWFHLSLCSVESVAVSPASGPFTWQRAVPNAPALIGLPLVWQAADLGANGTIEASNPAPVVVRQ